MPQVNVRLELPADLHRRLKYRALDEGKTLSKLLRELIAAGAEKDVRGGDLISPHPVS
jgi:predicted DNA-binding protein